MSGEFVARMEDVLDLYHADYDPDHPVVCFDETSRQLVADKRPVIGAKPGRVERYDYEYKRNGTRNLFMFCEPKAGWRHVEVTERRTAVDFAHQMRWLVDEAYPHTETIRLVLDNLNTHKLGSLYDAFKPAEARRIAKRLEIHYTPVHGSWLNMAEIELSVFSNQCLNRRISDEVVLKREVSALEHERNQAAAVIDWRFSTQDARTKLQHTYPSYSDGNGTSLPHCPAMRDGYQLFRQQALAEGIAQSGRYDLVVSAVAVDERNDALDAALSRSGIDGLKRWGTVFKGSAQFAVFTHQQWVGWVQEHDTEGKWSDWLSYVRSRYGLGG